MALTANLPAARGTASFETVETFGVDKRHRLVNRGEDARNAPGVSRCNG
jgi:hypothetical protein